MDAWLTSIRELVPKGYTLSERGTFKGKELVSEIPMVPVARFSGPSVMSEPSILIQSPTRKMLIPVEWILESGKYRKEIVRNNLDFLLNRAGGSVHRYFLDNRQSLREIQLQDHLGFNQDMDSFLLPSDSLNPVGDELPDPVGMVSELCGWCDNPYSGTLNGWTDGMNAICKHPRMAVALYASVASALLRILEAPAFCIQWAGPGSTGKSSCVALAASVWGNPDPLCPDPYIRSWHLPVKDLESHAYFLHDLPVCLDDTRSTGTGIVPRLQALLSGADDTGRRWRSVVIAAGQETLEELRGGESIVGRTLTLWGPPMGRHNQETAREVGALQKCLVHHWGVAGPSIALGILKARRHWPKWKTMWQDRRLEMMSQAAELGGNAASVAQHIATLSVAAELTHRLIPALTFTPEATIQDLWDWVGFNSNRESKSRLAKRLVMEYVAAHQERIVGLRDKQLDSPANGWIGVLDHGSGNVWIMGAIVQRILIDSGLKPMEIYREWLHAGDCVNTAGRYWRSRKIGRSFVRCISLT